MAVYGGRNRINACESVIEALPKDVKVIPGHGPVSTPTDVQRFVTMLEETSAAVNKGIESGKSLEQLKNDKVLEPWKQYSGPILADDFIDTLYNELTGKKATELLKH